MLRLVLALFYIITPVFGAQYYPNLYNAAQQASPFFAALIDRAGMKEKLSRPFNGTLLIPEQDGIARFITDFGILPNITSKDVCEILVNFHLLPNTHLDDIQSNGYQKIKTALSTDDIEIYRSPTAGHKKSIFYQRQGYKHLPLDIQNKKGLNWDGKHISSIIKQFKVDNNTEAALITHLLYPFDTIYNTLAKKDPLDAFPAVPANNVCETLKLSQLIDAQCTVLAAVQYGLNSGYIFFGCEKPNPEDYELPRVELNPLKDLRPLPRIIPLNTISKQDGASMYWMYRLIINMEDWATCAAQNPDSIFPLPEGWKVVSSVDLPQGSLPAGQNSQNPFSSIPFALILQNDAKEHAVLLMRGTTSGWEWTTDFKYNQTSDFTKDLFPSPMHDGISMVFSLVWPVFKKYLQETAPVGTIKHITIGGHSLGAGTTQMMGYAVQNYLDTARIDIVADAMAFAPPNVAGEEFVQQFNKKVNGRFIAYNNDLVTQVPCVPSMFACSNTSQYIPGWPVLTNMPGNKKSWQYSRIGGTVEVTNKNMILDNAWKKITSVPLTSPNSMSLFLNATHTCALMCYLSKYSGSGESLGDYCWLSEKRYENDPGSYCPGFEFDHSWP